MDLKNLFNKGKKMVDERGGVESLKEDAEELKNIASSKGSLADKAKEAASAIQDPGAPGGQPGQGRHQGQGQHSGQGQHRGQGQGQQRGQGQGGQGGRRPNRPNQ